MFGCFGCWCFLNNGCVLFAVNSVVVYEVTPVGCFAWMVALFFLVFDVIDCGVFTCLIWFDL